MNRLLKKFQALNYLDLLECKYIQATIEAIAKDKNGSKYENYANMLRYSSNFIKELDADLETESKHNLNLTRIVAIQDRELTELRNKVKRLEKHYETKGL